MGAERVRREQAERERDELAAELAALQEAREAPQTADEDAGEGPYSRPPKRRRRPHGPDPSVAGGVGGSGSSDGAMRIYAARVASGHKPK